MVGVLSKKLLFIAVILLPLHDKALILPTVRKKRFQDNDNTSHCGCIFRGTYAVQPLHGTAFRQQYILPCQPAFALVYGGFRHGGCEYLWCYVCECAWDGGAHGHDLYADLPRLHPRLLRHCLHSAACVLQA